MNKKEKEIFIEEMGKIGDVWTLEEVEDVYSNSTLNEALEDRKNSVNILLDNVSKLINN